MNRPFSAGVSFPRQSAISSSRQVRNPPPCLQFARRNAKYLTTRLLVVCAENEEKAADNKKDPKQEKLVAGLKQGGVDKETAQKILKVWEETGAKSPDQLRKLLVGRSLKAAGLVGIQTILDAGASWGAFTSANSLAVTGDFFGKIALEYVCYFLALYFGTSVLLDLFTLGAVAYSGLQYSTDSEAFLGAIREVAGPASGLNVVQKAQQAVNTAKVINALNRISEILRERTATAVGSGIGDADDSLRNLSVYLTLQKAEASGFRAADFNLNSNQAASVAAIFSKYDLNDDMVLSLSEVNRLFMQEGYNLSQAEVKQAIQLLDKNDDGLIQFSEFVEWWQKEIPDETKLTLEAPSNSKT